MYLNKINNMKKILLISSLVLIYSLSACDCGCNDPKIKKIYTFNIITTNGDTINTAYSAFGEHLFSLKSGDLTTDNQSKTLISGVRTYTVVIKELGKSKPKSDSDYILKPIEIKTETIDSIQE